MTSTRKYFDFIRSAWKNLNSNDQGRMAELWKGYEQAIASAYQKFLEARFGVSIENIFAFTDERWLPYSFRAEDLLTKATTYTTNQDLSVGISLQFRYLIKVSWDEEDPVEIDLRTTTPESVSIDEMVSIINEEVGFRFAESISNSVIKFSSPSVGLGSKIAFYPASDPVKDASEFVLGLSSTDLPKEVPDFPYAYEIPYPSLISVPTMQNKIRPDTSGILYLYEGTDYIIESTTSIAFKTPPPETMWATRNLFDEEWPWNNFGFLMGIYQPNSERYIRVLQGLWFAFWTGPRPENLKRALYLLFGLPTAPFDGVITAVSTTEITTTNAAGISITYAVPERLTPIVVLGEQVEAFQPLVDGIDVFDKVNYPGFIRTEIGRYGIQRFLTENASRGPGPDTDETKALRMLEEYTFLPQISVEAFVSPDINVANIRLFLDSIKPITKTYLFQVIVGEFQDEIPYEDMLAWHLSMDVTPSIDFNETNTQPQTVLDDHELVPVLGLSVDTEGYLMQESLEIEVYDLGGFVESFSA